MSSPQPALRYVGAGRFIPGIPGRDLETAELDVLAAAERRVKSPEHLKQLLLASGVYAADTAASEKPADEKESGDE